MKTDARKLGSSNTNRTPAANRSGSPTINRQNISRALDKVNRGTIKNFNPNTASNPFSRPQSGNNASNVRPKLPQAGPKIGKPGNIDREKVKNFIQNRSNNGNTAGNRPQLPNGVKPGDLNREKVKNFLQNRNNNGNTAGNRPQLPKGVKPGDLNREKVKNFIQNRSNNGNTAGNRPQLPNGVKPGDLNREKVKNFLENRVGNGNPPNRDQLRNAAKNFVNKNPQYFERNSDGTLRIPDALKNRVRPGNPGQGNRPNLTRDDIRDAVTRYRNRGSLPGLNGNPLNNRPSLDVRRQNLTARLNRALTNNSINNSFNNNSLSLAVNNSVNQNFNNWQNVNRGFNRWHRRWHRGFWPGFGPGFGFGPGIGIWGPRWSFWWNRYPVIGGFGWNPWLVNRAGFTFGYYGYSNPYCVSNQFVDYGVYDYTQPIIVESSSSSVDYTFEDDYLSSEPPSPGMAAFDEAQAQFYRGELDAALASVNNALKDMSNDAVVHEFRALVLFAMGDYQTAAATLYPVLSVGPGWNWSTLNSLYPEVAVYTKHLRALEDYRTANPQDAAARFVLAYHYTTCGHSEAAIKQLKALLAITPDDRLAAQLLSGLDPDAETPGSSPVEAPPAVVPPVPESSIDSQSLEGKWTANRGNDRFVMTLNDNGQFSWSFEQGGQPQTVKGVWSLSEKGILAMETDNETAMLAQVVLKSDNKMDFYMVGDTRDAEPLQFSKANNTEIGTPPVVPTSDNIPLVPPPVK